MFSLNKARFLVVTIKFQDLLNIMHIEEHNIKNRQEHSKGQKVGTHVCWTQVTLSFFNYIPQGK